MQEQEKRRSDRILMVSIHGMLCAAYALIAVMVWLVVIHIDKVTVIQKASDSKSYQSIERSVDSLKAKMNSIERTVYDN